MARCNSSVSYRIYQKVYKTCRDGVQVLETNQIPHSITLPFVFFFFKKLPRDILNEELELWISRELVPHESIPELSAF